MGGACYEAKLCDHPNICDPWKNEHCPMRRELFSADTEVEDHLECVDTPDHLLEAEAGRLSLPAASCAELRVIGACEVGVVNDLCAKTCGVCDGEQGHGRRLIGKCNTA